MSFEGNTLRLLESEGRKVVRWHSALFNTALVRRGSVNDPAGLAKVLAKAVESGGFKGRDVYTALEGTNTLSRVLSLPRGASVQVPDFIAREARRLWSVNQEESLLYWQPVAGTKAQFFVLSVPREPLHALEETVRLAGLRPVGADIRPLCLARALNQGRAVAVCVEGKIIVIVVLVDHFPVLMQTHLLG
ncbi:MAG: hypothetical protein HYY32_03620, partial [Chloroflexi bacterium]|nr:hypothetical protein [Chloroflexota bacterium]